MTTVRGFQVLYLVFLSTMTHAQSIDREPLGDGKGPKVGPAVEGKAPREKGGWLEDTSELEALRDKLKDSQPGWSQLLDEAIRGEKKGKGLKFEKMHTTPVEGLEDPRAFQQSDYFVAKKPEGLPTWFSTDSVQMRAHVYFCRTTPNEMTSATIGNGVFISKQWILTARHVAEHLELDPANVRIKTCDPMKGFQEWECDNIRWIDTDSDPMHRDPDLALVHVAAPIETVSEFPILASSDRELSIEMRVALFGANAVCASPNFLLGNITVPITKRRICDILYPRTVFGTHLPSYDGQSGSPVYDAKSGELIGIYVAGYKEWSRSGESLVKDAPKKKSDWPNYGWWSWVVPITKYRKVIDEAISSQK